MIPEIYKDITVEFTGPLVGQECFQSGGKALTICETVEDMVKIYKVFKNKYPNLEPPVVCIGIEGYEDVTGRIKENLEYISSFDSVVIHLGVNNEEVSRLLEAKIMEWDGNEKTLVNAWFSAKPYKPEGFVSVGDVFEEATKMPEWGRSWPWPTLTKLTYGRRLGEGYYFGAGVKIGKSECVNQLTHHIITEEKKKVALFKLEEAPAMTVRKIAGKIMNKQFHKPDGDFTREELIEGVEKVRDYLIMYDSYGKTDWDSVKQAIRYAVIGEGVQDVIIDPLTRLTVGMDSSQANTELERISDEISKMAKDLGFVYYIFCHLKSPESGKPHELGGKVRSNQFHGSRAMMRTTYYMLGIERNKDPELPKEERNTSTFVLLEDRAFGNSDKFEVYYDDVTGSYLEPMVKERL